MFMATGKEILRNNGAILNILQIIRAVMSSTGEAELGTLFVNAKMAVSMHQTLQELSHLQPWTPIQTNNSTAHALLTKKKSLQSIKSHGYEIPLAKMPRGPRTIPLLLEARNPKLGRLFHKTPPGQPPQIFPEPDSDITVRTNIC
jgi:hypothetical protein